MISCIDLEMIKFQWEFFDDMLIHNMGMNRPDLPLKTKQIIYRRFMAQINIGYYDCDEEETGIYYLFRAKRFLGSSKVIHCYCYPCVKTAWNTKTQEDYDIQADIGLDIRYVKLYGARPVKRYEHIIHLQYPFIFDYKKKE